MRKFGVAAALAVAVTTAAVQVPAPAAGAAALSQGDVIRVGNNSLCTLTFVDTSRSRTPAGYTSAHCGKTGDTVYTRANGATIPVGTFYPSGRYREGATANDWGLIRFYSGVALGGNPYTGDAEVPASELREGDRICLAGAATQQRRCGRYIGTVGGNVYWEDTGAQPGDSGGVVWIDGRPGLLGIFSGYSTVTTRTSEWTVMRAAMPVDSAPLTPNDEIQLITRYYQEDHPTGHVATVPVVVPRDGGGDAPQVRVVTATPADESTQKPLEGTTLGVILAIVLGVIVAAAPALAQIVETVRAVHG